MKWNNSNPFAGCDDFRPLCCGSGTGRNPPSGQSATTPFFPFSPCRSRTSPLRPPSRGWATAGRCGRTARRFRRGPPAIRDSSLRSAAALRPRHALVAGLDLADPLEDELLHAFALIGLGRIDVALRIDGDAVHAEELAGLAAAAAE